MGENTEICQINVHRFGLKQTFFSVWGVLREKYPSRSTNWAALRPYAGSSGHIAQVSSSSSSCWDLLEFLKRCFYEQKHMLDCHVNKIVTLSRAFWLQV